MVVMWLFDVGKQPLLWYKTPEWVAVFVTIVYVVVAALTLGAILYQAVTANRNARRTERPWLLIEGLRFTETVSLQGRASGIPSVFHCIIRNYGRTPARITALYMRTDISTSGVTPPHPEIYKLGDSSVYPHVIPQGDNRPHEAIFDAPLTDKDHVMILSGISFVWAYGIVRYRDVHGKRYETRVCYRNDTRATDLRLDGPKEYNQAE